MKERKKYIETYGFSDASEKAYRTCIFLRSKDSVRIIMVRLVTSKSKLKQLKVLTLSRLELVGVVVMARLATIQKRVF